MLAGPVPAAVQVYIVYDAAVPVINANPNAALAFARYLGRDAARVEPRLVAEDAAPYARDPVRPHLPRQPQKRDDPSAPSMVPKETP